MLNTPPKVLIFDSGVGGLSILQEVRRQLPWCQYVYACDNRAFPYGTKAESELVERVDTVLKALIAETAPDIVVIACNTASTVALPKIRAHFLNPVVGVVPAIKPAALQSRSKVIGLLATPATVKRPYTQWLIDEFAGDCRVVRVGSAELVELAEQKLRGTEVPHDQLRQIIQPFFDDPQLDTLVLACTHFPLLRAELTAVAPRPVAWIDSGEAIARRVASFTGQHPDPGNEVQPPPGFECWLTLEDNTTKRLEDGLVNAGATTIRNLDL